LATEIPALEKRSFRLAGHRTSVALEPEFWSAVERLARAQNEPVSTLVTRVDAGRRVGQGLASALRITILRSLELTSQKQLEAQSEGRQIGRALTGEDA